MRPDDYKNTQRPEAQRSPYYATRSVVAAPRRHSTVLRVISAVLTVGLFSFLVIRMTGSQPSQPTAANQQQVTGPVKPPKKDVTTMSQQINAVIARYPNLSIGVSVVDMVHGDMYDFGVQDPFVAASTAKIITAVYFFDQVEDGKYDLDQVVAGKPARQQIKLLIEDSDQTAWVGLNDLLGRPALEEFARNKGLQAYSTSNNTLTPRDIALLLKQLYGDDLLEQEHKDILLSHMKHASETQYIRAAVPEAVEVYHKAGYLKDRAHDAAIIDNHDYPFVLVIFSKAPLQYDFVGGIQLFHDITKAATATYL